MIFIELGKLGKVKIHRPTASEVVALVGILAFLALAVVRLWK